MHSNGPFKVYDHAEAQGPKEIQKMKNTNDQAMERFNDELEQIVNLKEMQKFQFANYFKKFDVI